METKQSYLTFHGTEVEGTLQSPNSIDTQLFRKPNSPTGEAYAAKVSQPRTYIAGNPTLLPFMMGEDAETQELWKGVNPSPRSATETQAAMKEITYKHNGNM